MKDKLMSRKFWMAAIAVVVVGLGVGGFDTDDVKSIVQIGSGMAVMLGYVLSEAAIDKAALKLVTDGQTIADNVIDLTEQTALTEPTTPTTPAEQTDSANMPG
jgi:hypothetical protein